MYTRKLTRSPHELTGSTHKLTRSPPAIHVCLAAAGLLFVTVVATAGSWEGPSVAVRYSASDLATTAAADALYRRIQSAAAKVCPDADLADLARYRVARQCREQAIERAVESVHSPLLAAVSAAHRRHA
ncbi:MAG TPA: UrcA family protein [Steroidobacteraceae bacterium]|nr:UrcA family protein [Steroidobacteraceae bacterium]